MSAEAAVRRYYELVDAGDDDQAASATSEDA